ncbi:hypothetical protein F5Y16DRAFT_416609 [Xylariaceae sp. FL0255]|nr:hypothetical protein F5Y16DRAFT_416609 [Xylariaceae sp. FL0255]
MAALPNAPHIVFDAGSKEGRIFSVNTDTGEVKVAIQHEALEPGPPRPGPVPPLGINGLRVRDSHVYFTNSAKGIFGCFRIDANGVITDELQILANSFADDRIYDDFTFDYGGNAYIAVHPSSVVKFSTAGVQTIMAGDELEGGSPLHHPTSAALANDGNSIYLVTGEKFGNPRQGGQIVRIDLQKLTLES